MKPTDNKLKKMNLISEITFQVSKRRNFFVGFSLFSIFTFSILISASAQEVSYSLNKGWKFRKVGTNDQWLPAKVPGTVHIDLMDNKIIADPFAGSNNTNLGWIDNTDWEYTASFKVGNDILTLPHSELVFDGLDTYAEVYLNGSKVLVADNMFRRWVVDCSQKLKLGENTIRVVFLSAVKKVGEKAKASSRFIPGGEWAWVRKAPYHFGWDWGPRFVTAGIWKNVKLRAWQNFDFKDIQIHTLSISKNKAKLSLDLAINSDNSNNISISVSTDKSQIKSQNIFLQKGKNSIKIPFELADPKLWWSNGAGEQFLYKFKISFTSNGYNGSKTISYGIKSFELIQKEDSIGKSFYFKLNGTPLFMKGANAIPRHSFLPSASEKDLKKLLVDAASSGINMLRIWGGGAYEDDRFYSLCDSLGILIWQDFMFAGSMYPGDSAYLANVREEVTYQVKRLRNHPSIALWNGNNEVDEAWHNWGWQKQYKISKADSTKIWQDYTKLFHQLIPEVLAKNDMERPYWPSSPKNGWGRMQSMTEGDSHYWGVWWGFQPFEVYKSKVPRFMSEYGFQGFPDSRTVRTFSKDGVNFPDSLELKSHQKHPVGYQTIDKYLQREFFKPRSIDEKIYLSQVLQSIGYQIAIESHRLAMPRCMGTLYWQLNDCWPVVSWSGIDFYGRWKAVQYTIQELYKPVLLSVEISNDLISIKAVSDCNRTIKGRLLVNLLNLKGESITSWSDSVSLPSSTPTMFFNKKQNIVEMDSTNLFVHAQFNLTSGEIFQSFAFNSRLGNLKLIDPEISWKIVKEGNRNIIVLTSKYPAFYVEISSLLKSFRVDKNYFHMIPGKDYRVKLEDSNVDGIIVKSLWDNIKKQ